MDETRVPESLGDEVRKPPGEAVGQSEAFLDFQEALARVARVDRPVLLAGERGTGKELAAARLHYLSGRWTGPLVTLNCAALAPTLIESELFGYEAGAFTGAARGRAGRFETADSGTLFLDELGNVPVRVQEKLLRAVEYGTFERVGSARSVSVDVRILGATHQDLRALVAEGRFMRDLLDRLSFEVLRLPPLRERAGDVALLARHFAARMARELGLDQAPAFSDRALAQLEAYAWPGNVRELKNVVERAVYRAEDASAVEEVAFDPFDGAALGPPSGPELPAQAREPEAPDGPEARGGADLLARSLPEREHALEVRMVREALARARYNQRRAARLLGLTYNQFRGRYRRLADELDRDA